MSLLSTLFLFFPLLVFVGVGDGSWRSGEGHEDWMHELGRKERKEFKLGGKKREGRWRSNQHTQ